MVEELITKASKVTRATRQAKVTKERMATKTKIIKVRMRSVHVGAMFNNYGLVILCFALSQ